MLTPLAPSAGPTGGEGLACPPRICNFITPSTSFAIAFVLNLFFFYLHKTEFQWCFSSENLNHHFQFFLFLVNLFYNSIEIIKRPINDFNSFTYVKGNI